MALRIDETTMTGRPVPEVGPFVAIVERDPATSNRMLRRLLPFQPVPFPSIDKLIEVGLQRISVIVVVLGPSQADEESLDQFGDLIRIRSGVGGVLVVDAATAGVMRMALRTGLDDSIALDNIDAELAPAVQMLADRLDTSVTGASQLQKLNQLGRLPPGSRGRVTAVFSPKGGVGKSVVSVNLAAALARGSDQPVVVVDLDLQFGDVAVMLRLQPAHDVSQLAGNETFDADLVRSLLVRHDTTGTFILAAPTEPSTADAIGARTVAQLLRVLRAIASHIVVDTPSALSDVVLQALDEADDIAFLVGLDVPSVKNARLGLQALEMIGVPAERVILVLNRADSKVNLAPRDVERVLDMKIDVSLPSDALVTQSVNKGIPAVLEYQRARFTASIEQLAQVVRVRRAEAVAR